MSDSAVFEQARTDQEQTQARIAELRSEIATQEEHLAEIALFLETYNRYASAAAPAIRGFAYAE